METTGFLCPRFKSLVLIISVLFMGNMVFAQVTEPACAGQIYSNPANGGEVAWLNASAARCDDNSSRAYVDLFVGENKSQFLHFTDFALGVPANARITGLEVVVIRKSDRSDVVVDRSIQLVLNGRLLGENQSQEDRWEDVWTGAFFGGKDNRWGYPLTPAVVNDPGFGVVVDVACSGSARAEIDEVLISVHYRYTNQPQMHQTAILNYHSCTPVVPAALGM